MQISDVIVRHLRSYVMHVFHTVRYIRTWADLIASLFEKGVIAATVQTTTWFELEQPMSCLYRDACTHAPTVSPTLPLTSGIGIVQSNRIQILLSESSQKLAKNWLLCIQSSMQPA